jgi:TonB family protein
MRDIQMNIRGAALLCFLMVISITMTAQSEPALISVNLPGYSPYARLARIQGDVKLTFSLAPNGREPMNIEAVSGHPLLKELAIENVKTWKFDNPNKVERKYETTFTFRLDSTPSGFPTATFESFHLVHIVTEPLGVNTGR